MSEKSSLDTALLPVVRRAKILMTTWKDRAPTSRELLDMFLILRDQGPQRCAIHALVFATTDQLLAREKKLSFTRKDFLDRTRYYEEQLGVPASFSFFSSEATEG